VPGPSSWLASKILAAGQQRSNVDPDLIAGQAPQWAVSFFRSIVALAVLPFALWLACSTLPYPWIEEAARFSDLVLWSKIKTIDLEHCGAACRDVVFGMVAYPVCSIAGILSAFQWFFLARAAHQYQRRNRERSNPGAADFDTAAAYIRKNGNLLPVLFIGFCIFAAAMLMPVGRLSASADDPSLQTAGTRFTYCVFCSVLAIGLASFGSYGFLGRLSTELPNR
jgi:hypothetical protein